jgi:hypothetical protein
MFPRKLAMDFRNEDHDCVSAGGASSKELGMSGVFILLDMMDGEGFQGGTCCWGQRN